MQVLSDPSSQLFSKTDLPSNHAVISDHTGTDCGTLNRDLYIENCDYDRSGKNNN